MLNRSIALLLLTEQATGGAETLAMAEIVFSLRLWQLAALSAALLILFVLFVWILAGRKKRGEQAKSMTKLHIAKLHEQGSREEQQDSFGVSDESLAKSHGVLIAVADGMGGLENGGRISAAVVESVLDHFLMYVGERDEKALLLSLTREALRTVNELLGPEGYRKSGSTLALGYIRDGQFSFISIGDSRICLLRGGALLQLNREHSYAHELSLRAVNGELSVSDALRDPKGSALVSFIGMGELEQFDMPASPIRLLAGDKLILMSDGVYNALSEEEFLAALSAPCEEAADRLRAAINKKQYSNQDNFTAVIAACG